MNWDKYFYDIALAVAKNSKCLSRQIGAVLVRDHSIIATGYNGPARGVPHCETRFHQDQMIKDLYHNIDNPDLNTNMRCPRHVMGYKSGQGLEICLAAHAETNCIANASRNGVNTMNSTMYLTCETPCKNCLVLLINAGIKRIFCIDNKLYDDASNFILQHSDIIIDTYEKENS